MDSGPDSLPGALIICTLNRPQELLVALEALLYVEDRPQLIVVVDASTTSATEKIVRRFAYISDAKFIHLPSAPGLPRQRNLGIAYVLGQVPKPALIHFLDDDVAPMPGYFNEIAAVFISKPDAICVGGRDIAREVKPIPLSTRLIGTNSKREGRILRTAWNIHCSSTDSVLPVDWLSGLSQTFRTDALGEMRFDEGIRFYGEDVDMHVRCSRIGALYWTPFAEVRHFESKVNRAQEDEVMMWTDASKWMLCCNYPDRFSKSLFLMATGMHMILKVISGLLHRDSIDLRTARGHARFFGRLMTRKPMRQPIAS